MNTSLEDLYFRWLYAEVSDPNAESPLDRFYTLFNILHNIEFVWIVANDDDRIQDGLDLRAEFLNRQFIANTGDQLTGSCSVLEMLVAFSRRASFNLDESPQKWFWIMIDNLSLRVFSDAVIFNPKTVQDIVEKFVYRVYDRKGNGGLFPMRSTREDQRHKDIWYQFNEYIISLGY